MLKKISVLALAAVSLGTAVSAPISPEEALSRAQRVGSAEFRIPMSKVALAHVSRTDKGVVSAYVFVPENGEGFTVLSADDAAIPVLGYSTTGRFDVDNIPPAMTWWLGELARQSEACGGASRESIRPYAPSGMAEIAPLMSTSWNQDAPYNLFAPMVGGVQAPTGCVATSVAQVMNYFEWPKTNKGIIQYYDGMTQRTLNLRSKGDFQWDKMLDSYSDGYTKEQGDAVAYLMQAAGYSVEMSYGSQMSGAVSFKIADAMVKYFGYDSSINYKEREYFSPAQWTHMIYDNLKNVGPVIYDGRSIDGGHSFVCDGYDGNGYFHFNWGWGGMSDGYYLLDSLNPESQGIGGAEGGFNFSQGAIFAMRKPDAASPGAGYDMMTVIGTVKGSLKDGCIVMQPVDDENAGWGNGSYRQISCNVGGIICKADASETLVGNVEGVLSANESLSGMSVVELSASTYYSGARMTLVVKVPSDLPDGKYKVYCGVRQADMDDAPWQKMMVHWGSCNYVYLTVADGKHTVETAAPESLDFTDVDITSPLYVGRNARMKYEVENSTDLDLCYCFSPQLWKDGKLVYDGDMMLVSVPAKSKVSKDALVAFYPVEGGRVSGTFTLKLVNRNSNQIIGTFGDYDMTYVSSTLEVSLDELSVENAEIREVTSGGRKFNAYEADRASDFNIRLKYDVKSGYLDTSVRLIASRYNPDTNKFENFPDNIYYSVPFLGEGQSCDVVIPADFSKYDYASVFRVVASYLNGGSNTVLGSMYLTFKSSDLNEAFADDLNEVEYFNMQGIRVDTPSKGDILIKKSGNQTSIVRF